MRNSYSLSMGNGHTITGDKRRVRNWLRRCAAYSLLQGEIDSYRRFARLARNG